MVHIYSGTSGFKGKIRQFREYMCKNCGMARRKQVPSLLDLNSDLSPRRPSSSTGMAMVLVPSVFTSMVWKEAMSSVRNPAMAPKSELRQGRSREVEGSAGLVLAQRLPK